MIDSLIAEATAGGANGQSALVSSTNSKPPRVIVTPQFVHAVSSIVWAHCNRMATDLDAFAKHGKRSVVSVDDVKLCVRRNPALVEHLAEFAAGLKGKRR
ncbi:hypothetical protein HDU83_001017 [Entophlyctis luteolus]|nr:hypothetical protein HDU82_008293 [Entophlyctis luteolus]KAJ3348815.1 hypothetical protein HDU83_001017 [Entophlyctis luteolus]